MNPHNALLSAFVACDEREHECRAWQSIVENAEYAYRPAIHQFDKMADYRRLCRVRAESRS